MSSVNLPLSSPVTQAISPFLPYFPMFGSQVGAYTVNLGTSSQPAVETDVLAEVGSYGRQLGRLGDALHVLLQHVQIDPSRLSDDECQALEALRNMTADAHALADLQDMLTRVAAVKARHAPADRAVRLTIQGDRVDVEARTADEAARLLELARAFRVAPLAPQS